MNNISLNSNQLVIMFIVIVLMYFIYTRLKKQTENLTETQSENENKDKLANEILNFINPNTEYKDYLDFLVKIPYNLSMKILEQEVFYEMKFLVKSDKLSKDTITQYLTDM
jgi:hypothetical protein